MGELLSVELSLVLVGPSVVLVWHSPFKSLPSKPQSLVEVASSVDVVEDFVVETLSSDELFVLVGAGVVLESSEEVDDEVLEAEELGNRLHKMSSGSHLSPPLLSPPLLSPPLSPLSCPLPPRKSA